MSSPEFILNRRQYLEFEKIALGAFAPLSGFMNEEEFISVVERMRLPDHTPYPLPVILDLTRERVESIKGANRLSLAFEGREVGELVPEDIYTCDKEAVAEKVFSTCDGTHPGVAQFFRMGDFFVGGQVRLTRRVNFEFSDHDITPAETCAYFAKQGWKTIAGFQTRNVPHRAHEYLLRLALEQVDGLYIQPLVGTRKQGDYTPLAILAAYRKFIDGFLPSRRVLLGVLSTSMRFAGPREALFHAIIRRNYGCTHFIVGRDQAGVGGYYGKYEAHELTRSFDGELGIEILRYHGPFYCQICEGVVTERSCPHAETAPEMTREISGSVIRNLVSNGQDLEPELIRPEVLMSIRHLPLFIDKDTD